MVDMAQTHMVATLLMLQRIPDLKDINTERFLKAAQSQSDVHLAGDDDKNNHVTQQMTYFTVF